MVDIFGVRTQTHGLKFENKPGPLAKRQIECIVWGRALSVRHAVTTKTNLKGLRAHTDHADW